MATLSQVMGIPAAGLGVLAPKHKNKFQVRFVNLGILVPTANSRDLTAQVQSVTLPTRTTEKIELHR